MFYAFPLAAKGNFSRNLTVDYGTSCASIVEKLSDKANAFTCGASEGILKELYEEKRAGHSGC